MRLQINGRYLAQRVTGQQRYARELVSRFSDNCDVIQPAAAAKGPPGHLWEQFVLPLRKGQGLLWSPSTTGPLAIRKQVVTVHDCAFFDQAECFSRSFAAWYQQLVPPLVRRVRRVITVSEFSRERIVAHCRVPADRVAVVYSGVDQRFAPQAGEMLAATRHKLSLPERYVLCVGSLEPRKNLRRLLAAWRIAQPSLEGVSLVLVGAKSHVFRDAGLAEPPPAVQLAGYVGDDLLPAVYAGAELFVYPSIYEGFGLPVLEAMACGTPVVCSNVTALPEVAGGAALLVDPYAPEAIADAILQMARDTALQARLRAAGFARAAAFRWEDAAAATWRLLEEAAA